MPETPRKTITSLAAAWALTFPQLSAWGAVENTTATAPKRKPAPTTFTGPVVECKRWGPIQVRIKVKKTTSTVRGKKRVSVKILRIDVPVAPHDTAKTRYINDQAIPILIEQALAIQDANVEVVSGATDTTVSFTESLQAAILKAKKP